jgi:hypothetical protein
VACLSAVGSPTAIFLPVLVEGIWHEPDATVRTAAVISCSSHFFLRKNSGSKKTGEEETKTGRISFLLKFFEENRRKTCRRTKSEENSEEKEEEIKSGNSESYRMALSSVRSYIREKWINARSPLQGIQE